MPLAIQWLLARYKKTGDLKSVLEAVGRKDSPILEFSFRNIWNTLTRDAKTILAVLSIFDEPPIAYQVSVATEWHMERVERALSELTEVTLVNKVTNISDGRILYTALPITLDFAKHQLPEMGSLEIDSRRRIQRFNEEMELQSAVTAQFQTLFERYGIQSDNEKRAAILCRRADSEALGGNIDNAENLYRQAREMAPNSSYVFAMSAKYELDQRRIGLALDYARESCKRATKKTGSLAHTVFAQIHDLTQERQKRVEALERALEYDPNDLRTRHQYGVALSRIKRYQEAIEQFSQIIQTEMEKPTPTDSLVYALTSRARNFKRIGNLTEAKQDLQVATDLVSKTITLSHLRSQLEYITEEILLS